MAVTHISYHPCRHVLTHLLLAMQAGCQNKPTVFLFDETQIVQETFLEDINNILTSGGQQGLTMLHNWIRYCPTGLSPLRAAA